MTASEILAKQYKGDAEYQAMLAEQRIVAAHEQAMVDEAVQAERERIAHELIEYAEGWYEENCTTAEVLKACAKSIREGLM